MYSITIIAHIVFFESTIVLKTILGAHPLALAIDTQLTSQANLATVKNFICHYPVCQQYVATTSVPLLQTFHAPRFENPGSSPESNKTVVIKLHHSCIF